MRSSADPVYTDPIDSKSIFLKCQHYLRSQEWLTPGQRRDCVEKVPMAKNVAGWLLFLVTFASSHVAARAQQRLVSSVPAVRNPVPATQQGATPATQAAPSRYVIKRGDTVSISFDLATELNQTLPIEPDGYINLRSGPAIHAEGMTVAQLNAAVKQAYSSIVSSASIVTVEVSNFQKPFFTVTGQVGKPGQYELRADISISEAIAVAGGLLPTAKTQILFYHKESDQWFRVEKVNLQQVLTGKHLNLDAHLQPGDMIFIPEKGITNFRKYVPYSLSASAYAQQTPY
jgi:polysaccharide export outer membrane protein